MVDPSECFETCIDRLFKCIERAIKMVHERQAQTELHRLASKADEMTGACTCDPNMKGSKVEVSRYCVSGEGTALASVDVEQQAAYWEVDVVSLGTAPFRVGLSHRGRNEESKQRLENSIGDNIHSWGLASTSVDIKEGDIIGVYFDQRDLPTLKFSVNGELVDESRFLTGIKGDVRPAVSVDKGTILKFRFDSHSFKHPPSGPFSKFSPIIKARNVL